MINFSNASHEAQFEHACRDDCFTEMVPSDLRGILTQRDRYYDALAAITTSEDPWSKTLADNALNPSNKPPKDKE